MFRHHIMFELGEIRKCKSSNNLEIFAVFEISIILILKTKGEFAILRWLDAKRDDDNVDDGLWRIDNTLYDLTNFIDKHPGGPSWLQMTKGHDITEMFYSHHLKTEKLQPFLAKYRVKETTRPRNVKLTFHENGFYMTLRRKVAAKLPQIKKTTKIYSQVYQLNDFLIFFRQRISIFHKFIVSVLHRRFICFNSHHGHSYATISKHINGDFVQFISHMDWSLCT